MSSHRGSLSGACGRWISDRTTSVASKRSASAMAAVMADTSIPWVNGSSKRVMITITSRYRFLSYRLEGYISLLSGAPMGALHLDAYLVDPHHRRFGQQGGDFVKLLLQIAAGLAGLQIDRGLPQGDRDPLSRRTLVQ